jgi:hypothetical protein
MLSLLELNLSKMLAQSCLPRIRRPTEVAFVVKMFPFEGFRHISRSQCHGAKQGDKNSPSQKSGHFVAAKKKLPKGNNFLIWRNKWYTSSIFPFWCSREVRLKS